jgi:FecR protein
LAEGDWSVPVFQIGVLRRILTMALVMAASSAWAAEDGIWSVSKSSGEVWITTSGAEQVSLKQEEALKPGDTIRTGRTGRVLLVHGEETILISPSSVVGLPAEKKEGLSTTIVQQAGSILLEVEKRNVKHFEVETPYLAAVVKGTQFSVTVDAAGTSVEVRRGQVEVSDFKSGQIAQVMPGQVATAFAHGKTGLSLSGSGTFNAIEQGKPRASSIERVPVPRSGLSAPGNAASGKFIHALGRVGAVKLATTLPPQKASGDAPGRRKGVRISAALGEVRLNFQKVTHGLAHEAAAPGSAKKDSGKDTVWSDAKAGVGGANGLNQSNSNASSSGSAANSSAATTSSGIASTVAAVAGAATDSGNGNGANGNGKGNNGNGNNGNGNNGNGGVGNGNGKGNAKH